MARSQYPTGDDLQAFLLSAGFSATFLSALNLDYQRFADVGRDDFESKVGRRMLATSETRTFPPPLSPRGILDLADDLASASTVTYNAVTLTTGTQYLLLPQNAAGRGRPYAQMQFLLRWITPLSFAMLSGVAITGLWGYGATIPEDAWQGMLESAALRLWPLLAQARTRGMQMWREADMAESYGPTPLQHLRDGWLLSLYGDEKLKMLPGTINQYRRVTVG